MKFQRKGTQLIYNVTNPDLIPLFEGNEAYEKVEERTVKETKKTTSKKN